MKKTILTIMATIMVMAIIGVGYISSINKQHEKELEIVKASYEMKIESMENEMNVEMEEMKKEYDELEQQVYNMMNGDEYDFRIKLDNGEYHSYSYKKEGLFFGEKSHSMTKVTNSKD